MNAIHPLLEVAEHVRTHSGQARVAVVFDLDSTLFCVSSRTESILRELAAEPGIRDRFPREAALLKDIRVLPSDWGVRSVLERTLTQSSIEFFKEVRGYWGKHFFSSRFLDRDTIYPSAPEYVKRLHDFGADIMYLTGRGERAMREGTVAALRRHGFPYLSESKLMMKPSEIESDEGFKASVMRGLVHGYDHIWFFENEPVIIEQVRAVTPQVRIVFVDTVHAGRAPAPSDLMKIAADYKIGLGQKTPGES
ncbi:MAG TPA: HAD family hydrolase [Bdellovibrionales bacterium]|nr:HAD family hydrolase [Bdellovibrionales bacterium]